MAHVTQGLEMGGLEKLLVELARHADRQRFSLHFVSLGGRGGLADEIEGLGWPVTPLDRETGFQPGLFLRLRRLFRRAKVDVVHTHDERPHIYAAPAAKLAGIRQVIHTRHRGQTLSASRRQRWLLELACKLTRHFVCVSQDSARLAIEQGAPREKVSVIWNGIDLDRFQPGTYASDGPVVTVARMSPEKDIATLIQATAIASTRDPSFRLEVAGDGPCLPDLRKQTDQLGLDKQVTFLGQVREIPSLLSRSSLFVLPSRTEGISLTLLEAMASGLPIVTTRVGGSPEVVAEGQTGLLVPSAEPSALADALLTLWRDPARRLEMGQAGRRRVEQHFDIRKMVAAYERLYAGA